MKTIQRIVIPIMALLVASCGNYLERKSSDGGESQNRPNVVPDFATLQTKLFAPRCVSCHQQYRDYSGVRRELDAILSAIRSDRMPKTGGPLSASQKDLFTAWVESGAAEFAGQDPTEVSTEILPVWQSVYDNIISSRCLVCHSPIGQAKFLDLSTRQAIFRSRDRTFGDGRRLLDFNQPENSYLLEVIQDEAEPMPPKSSRIRPLNEVEIDVLKEWIRLGLP